MARNETRPTYGVHYTAIYGRIKPLPIRGAEGVIAGIPVAASSGAAVTTSSGLFRACSKRPQFPACGLNFPGDDSSNSLFRIQGSNAGKLL